MSLRGYLGDRGNLGGGVFVEIAPSSSLAMTEKGEYVYLGLECNLATPRGFEPLLSTVTGWHVCPLHHGAVLGGSN